MIFQRTNLALQKRGGIKLMSGEKSYKEMSDGELVLASQQQDKAALECLLKRYERQIVSKMRHLAPDWQDTSDFVQEAFIRIWHSIRQLQNPSSFKTWLNKIVHNLFYDELRKRKRQAQFVFLDDPIVNENGSASSSHDIPDSSPQPEDRLLNSELSEVLAEAMSGISDQFKTAALLRDVEGLSYEEIAQITNTEIGTVKSRISRARLKIQERLRTYLRDCA